MFITCLIVATSLFINGCSSNRATIKTFIDPSIQTDSIKKVAVFPMRNTAFSPGETMEIDKAITQAFMQKNSSVSTIGTTESTSLLNKENLVADFADFLKDFELSGIANTVFLKKLKTQFNIDAILQGRLSDVHQNDAMRGGKAQAALTVRYTLLSTKTGNILWEGTSSAAIEYGKSMGRTSPPFYQIGIMAEEKIISSIPTIGGSISNISQDNKGNRPNPFNNGGGPPNPFHRNKPKK